MATRTSFESLMPTTVKAFGQTGLRKFLRPGKITLRMTKDEVTLFSSVLMRNSDSPYLEFGSGGSTLLAAGIVPQVISVENDSGFIQYIVTQLATLPKKCIPQFIAIHQGPLEKWGFPVTTDPAILKAYAETVWRASVVPDNVKTVLVDGRFRRSCLLHSILHLDSSVDFLLHDANRYVDLTQDFFIEIEQADNLKLLRKTREVTDDQIMQRLSEVEYIKQ